MAKKKQSEQERIQALLKTKLQRDPDPDLAEVAKVFIKHAGGTEAFGKLLWDFYCRAQAEKPGGMAAQRVLETVTNLLKAAGRDKEFKADDLDALGTEQLEDLLREYAGKLSLTREPDAAPPAAAEGKADGQAVPAPTPEADPAACI